MTSSGISYHDIPDPPRASLKEDGIESGFIGKLIALKYTLLAKPNSRLTKFRLTAQGRA